MLLCGPVGCLLGRQELDAVLSVVVGFQQSLIVVYLNLNASISPEIWRRLICVRLCTRIRMLSIECCYSVDYEGSKCLNIQRMMHAIKNTVSSYVKRQSIEMQRDVKRMEFMQRVASSCANSK